MTNASPLDEFRMALARHAELYGVELTENEITRLCDHFALLLKWNPRLHLVAPCSPAEFATRHVLESLFLLRYLEGNARVADVGSGAGLPAIPYLIVRSDVQATLIEASKKKCVFLREALRRTKTSRQAEVIAERFEEVPTPAVDFITSRALDRFSEMLPKLVQWSPPGSTLLLFGGEELQKKIEDTGLKFSAVRMPDSERRFLYVLRR
jgi:16S rRNA (guanine527-N7)-methyltransferase